MSHHLAFMFAVSMTSGLAHGQTAEQFASNASTVAQRLPTTVRVSPVADSFMRSEVTFLDVRHDVLRTESVLQPIAAKATVVYVMRGSERQPTEEAARAAELPMSGPRVLRTECSFTYVPTQTGWTYHAGACVHGGRQRELDRAEVLEGKRLGPDVIAARAFLID
jgi:hypothetical protein